MNIFPNILLTVISSLISVAWFHQYLNAKKKFPGRIKINCRDEFIPAMTIIGYGIFVFPLSMLPVFGNNIYSIIGIEYKLNIQYTIWLILGINLIFYTIYWMFIRKNRAA